MKWKIWLPAILLIAVSLGGAWYLTRSSGTSESSTQLNSGSSTDQTESADTSPSLLDRQMGELGVGFNEEVDLVATEDQEASTAQADSQELNNYLNAYEDSEL